MRELEGSCNQSSMAVDTSITKELTNNLYNSIKVNGNGTEAKGINLYFCWYNCLTSFDLCNDLTTISNWDQN